MAIWNDYNWDFWDREKELLVQHPKKFRKISICTTCMNRTYDLEKTFIQNIKDNEDYSNVEFVLLNYCSKDNLEEWVKNNLMEYIEKGIVKYCKVLDDISHYDMSHSRNVVFKLCENNSICNSVDADNFLGKTKDGTMGFASLINKMAETINDRKAVYFRSKRLAHGRLGMKKEDFMLLGGYPEKLEDGTIFEGYGWDDKCLLYRAGALGFKMMWFCGDIDVNRIHSGKDKAKHMKNPDWKQNEDLNYELTMKIMKSKEFIMHRDHHWGKAKVQINFSKELDI